MATVPQIRAWSGRTPIRPEPRPLARRTARLSKSERQLPTILWVDDYEPGLLLYKAMFEALGFRVLAAKSGVRALHLAAENRVDVAVTDYEMPGMNGGEVAASLKRLKPTVPVILFSGSLDIPDRVKSDVQGVCDKAGSRDVLLGAIKHAVAGKRLPRATACR